MRFVEFESKLNYSVFYWILYLLMNFLFEITDNIYLIVVCLEKDIMVNIWVVELEIMVWSCEG